MAEGEGSKEPETGDQVSAINGEPSPKTPQATATDDTEDEEEEEEEPRLKYAPLTKNLTSLYRNGDASSAFLVAGDKMVCSSEHGQACWQRSLTRGLLQIIGTHNGNTVRLRLQ